MVSLAETMRGKHASLSKTWHRWIQMFHKFHPSVTTKGFWLYADSEATRRNISEPFFSIQCSLQRPQFNQMRGRALSTITGMRIGKNLTDRLRKICLNALFFIVELQSPYNANIHTRLLLKFKKLQRYNKSYHNQVPLFAQSETQYSEGRPCGKITCNNIIIIIMSRHQHTYPWPSLSPPLPIVHCFRQVFLVTSCIDTELLYVGSSWLSCLCSSMWKGPQE